MVEVTINNFNKLLPRIKEHLRLAKFIAIDLEFSALDPIQAYSLFDDPKTRYAKLRKNVEKSIPLQIGVTAFLFNPDKNQYDGKTYTFFVMPALFSYINKHFLFQVSSIKFLCLYNFDFNKFAYSSIPYLSIEEEKELKSKLESGQIIEGSYNFGLEVEQILDNDKEAVQKWLSKAQFGDILSVPGLHSKCKQNYELKYFLHQYYRTRLSNVWTYENEEEFYIKKVRDKEIRKLREESRLEDDLIRSLRGFSEVYQMMVEAQKPVVGHNLLQDLVILLNCFEGNLPKSYGEFKRRVTSRFPNIFDTKHISYHLRKQMAEEKQWDRTDLKSLYEYFRGGMGRHLAAYSPIIETDKDFTIDNQFHEAGWDSFCTGYVFIRLAYLNVYRQFPTSKKFMSSELINGLSAFKNRVNLIRASTSFINLEGADPESTRPPWLVIESKGKKPINVHQVTAMLGSYGLVEVRQIMSSRSKAIIAIDNYSRKISDILGKNKVPIQQIMMSTKVTRKSGAKVWKNIHNHTRS